MAKLKAAKIALLYSSKASHWGSCNSISDNLKAAYRLFSATHDVQWFPYVESEAVFDLRYGGNFFLRLAKDIFASGATKLVLVDHQIMPIPLIHALKAVDARKFGRLEFVFHVYGDFNLFSDQWRALGDALEGSKVKLLCASERQMQMVRFFEKDTAASATGVCPFPVDTKYYAFSPILRSRWRAKLSLSRQHFTLYSGRLSLQKGIVSLIEEFRHQVELGADAVLGIAGAFDDIGSPTTGLNLLPGYFYQRVQEALSLLPPEIQKRVLILGNLSKEELRGLYSAADSFVSLSLYHDEDFGMAPAEALSCGLPSLLSSWGGYSSFAVKGAPVTLIDTSISERGLNLDYSKLRAKWNAILTAPLDPAARAKASRAFRKVFSVPAVAATLHELHQLTPPHFTGFSWKLSIPKTSKMLRQGLYQDIYTNYVSSHSEETL